MDPFEFDQRISVGLNTETAPQLPGLAASSPRFLTPLILAGVDEAGRGPLAGPVVAAAVILPPHLKINGLNDSKKLSPERREDLFAVIQENALATAVSVIDNEVIDLVNVLVAALTAMREAIHRLTIKPDLVLVDGHIKPGSSFSEQALIKGDGKSACIMAASILAKVTRDRLMVDLHQKYPQYGFDQHKGYGCASHIDAIKKFGPSPVHRHSFEPIRSLIKEPSTF